MSIAELDVSSYSGPSDGPDDRVPPQDVHAEQSRHRRHAAVQGRHRRLRRGGSRAHDFYRPAHELIYDAILDLYGRGEPADAITVSDELTKRGDLARVGGQAYLHQLIASVPTAANAGYYAQIVAERAVLRRLVDAGTRIVQLGYGQGGGDVEDIVNAAQAEVYAVADKRGGEDYHVLGDVLEATVDEIEHASGSQRRDGRRAHRLHRLRRPDQRPAPRPDDRHRRPAGGRQVDLGARHRPVGGDQAQASPPSCSRLEMSRTEITMRLLSAEAGIQLQHMRKGTMRDEDWTRLARTMGEVSDAPLFIDDSPNMSLMEIRAKCRRLKQRHNLKLVDHRLPAADELGQAGRVPPAGGLRVLPCAQAAGQGARGAGHRAVAS